MSRLDETPVFKFKRNYDINAKRTWVPVEGTVDAGRDRTSVRRQTVPVDDGVIRGRVEGVLSLKAHWDRTAARLNWDNNEYYDNFLLCTAGVAQGAVERVLDNEMFSVPANRVAANRVRFFQNICADMSGNQTDARGVVLEHMKREVSTDNPDDNLARLRDIRKLLPLVPGTTPCPTEAE